MSREELIETMARAIALRCEPFSHVPKKLANSFARDALAAAEAAGFAVVPKEPNLAMQNAGWREVDKQGFSTEDTEVAPIYRAMIGSGK